MLKILGIITGVLLGSLLLVVVIGYTLPEHHVAARAISLRKQPAEVFALISNVKNEPSWRSDVQQVELLPDQGGRTRFREKSKQGALTFEVLESNPPQRLVTRLDDNTLPFGGEWVFEVSPLSDGCMLNITERGEIYNPVFRFVSRFILGYNATLDSYLNNVAHRFGETATPVEGRADSR